MKLNEDRTQNLMRPLNAEFLEKEAVRTLGLCTDQKFPEADEVLANSQENHIVTVPIKKTYED